jgi:diguanylate cyclase (GGDEF)-like protein
MREEQIDTPTAAVTPVQLLYELSRRLARAQSYDELIGLTCEAFRSVDLRCYVAELDGDALHLHADAVEGKSLVRIEAIVGQSLDSLGLRGDTFPFIHSAITRRSPAMCADFVGLLLPLMPHLSSTEGASLRREVGRGPFTAVPFEFGDEMPGLLLAWGRDTLSEVLPFLQVVAAQLGAAWGRLNHATTARSVRDDARSANTPDGALLRTLIDSGGIRVAMQPVVRLHDGVVLGYECLCGRTGAGEAHGLERELDIACIRAALIYATHTTPATLFLDVSIASLLAADAARRLATLVADAGVRPQDVVLQLREGVRMADVARLRRIVADLRSCGFRIAVDETGTAAENLLVIAEVRPDFIKIDRHLTRGVHSSDARRALVVSLLSLATHINAAIIAEGIENEDDLRALTDLGIRFGQGDHVGQPVALAPDRVAGAVTVEPSWFGSRPVERFPSEPGATGLGGQARPHAQPSDPKKASLPHALSRAALALQAEHDPQRILEVIAEQLSLVVPVDDLSIYEADNVNHRFAPVYANGHQASAIMADPFPISVGLNGWAFALGTPQNLANAGAHPAALTIPGTPFEHESLLLIPLVAGDHKLGMLNCRRMGLNRFTDDDLEAASLFGHTAAAAWHNAQLYKELDRRAMTDGLTGLFNSRWLREAGEREIADCRRRGTALSIVLIDLDHFKKINDTGGHAAGDVVLQRVADELRRTTRAGDAAVRLGGEEFVLVLRDSDTAGAAGVASDLRQALTNVPIPSACSGIDQITASMGIAGFPEHGTVLADLVRAADVAMYGAKRAGRDRVNLAVGRPATADDDGVAVA